MSIDHFAVDRIVQETMRDCAADRDLQWEENHITIEIIKNLRNHFKSIDSDIKTNNRRSIVLELYKNKGKIENRFGDITFLIRRFIGNSHIDGVGFCEAKREFDTHEFKSLKFDQLVNMNANVANHKLLLYLLQYDSSMRSKHERMNIYPYFYTPYLACTIPSINAISIKSRKPFELINDSIPLSYQLLGKYLEGFDLVYDRRIINDVAQGREVGSLLVYIVHGYSDQIDSGGIDIQPQSWEKL